MDRISVIYEEPSEDLSRKISRKIKGSLVKAETKAFPDGESKITLKGKLSKTKTVIVQSIFPPVDSNLMHAISLIMKAKEMSSEVIAVVPYMGYARQDREFLPGEIVSMKVLGKLFKSAGASKVVVVDIHSMTGLGYFRVKTKNVSAIPNLVKYFKKTNVENPLIISPDQGGSLRAKEFAEEFGTKHIVLEKKRDRKTGAVKIKTKDAEVKGRDLIIVDDMISTGGSIIKAAQFLKKQKCKQIFVACTHALLIDNAEKKIREAGVTKIVSSNTIPGKTSLVDVSDVISNEI